jgi:hypothetical protein
MNGWMDGWMDGWIEGGRERETLLRNSNSPIQSTSTEPPQITEHSNNLEPSQGPLHKISQHPLDHLILQHNFIPFRHSNGIFCGVFCGAFARYLRHLIVFLVNSETTCSATVQVLPLQRIGLEGFRLKNGRL